MEYASDALVIFREARCFYSILREIGVPGVGEKKKKFNFMHTDRQGRRTEERYSQSVRYVSLISCRAFMYHEGYRDVEEREGSMNAVQD